MKRNKRRVKTPTRGAHRFPLSCVSFSFSFRFSLILIKNLQPDEQGRLFVHGLLTASLPTRIGSRMNVWAHEMTCQWTRPVYTGETVQCVVRVDALDPSERGTRMRVSICCTNANAEIVLQGHCTGVSPFPMSRLSEMSVADLSD